MKQTIKHLTLAIAAMSVVALAGCKKDNNNTPNGNPNADTPATPPTEYSIIGQWRAISQSDTVYYLFYQGGTWAKTFHYNDGRDRYELADFAGYTYDKNTKELELYGNTYAKLTVTKLTDRELQWTLNGATTSLTRVSGAKINNTPLFGSWTYILRDTPWNILFNEDGSVIDAQGRGSMTGTYRFDEDANILFIKRPAHYSDYVYRLTSRTNNSFIFSDGTPFTRDAR